MAFAQTLSPQTSHHPFRDVHSTATPPMQRRQASKQRFVAELSQCLFDSVIQLLPTQEEMAVKEDVRKLLERLIRTIEPESRLLSFGSTANGFSLRNSDMDLCCLIDSEERLAATDLVTMLGDLLERETKFHVKPLPHARIPIVKLSLDPSPGLPLGIACDIGFENRLALENTRLLMCYAMIDPTRVRTMVLFLKVWSKRRKINSPYKGTLSSYGYVLLVIYFLVHVKNPPVLPNLQQMPPLRPISKEDTHLNGHNIWFFDDIDLLRQRWHSENVDTVAELLIDFFRYYSRDFLYNTGVASIRAGLIKKDSKGWQNELSGSRYNDARERNRLCIEDPFETEYNVARCVTKDGLYTIRGEFMRASRILSARPERAIVALADLCEERKDEELVVAPPYHSRPVSLPPQTPYTVGNQTLRPKVAERFSPPAQFFEPGPRQVVQPVALRPPPEHMAPKRGKWTSPPPPEAPPDDHNQFESQLGIGLQLATSSTDAREQETAYNSSESNSEVFTDEGSDIAEDDMRSVRSYTEGSSNTIGALRRPSWHTQDTLRSPTFVVSSASSSRSPSTTRGRFSLANDRVDPSPPSAFRPPPEFVPSSSHSSFNKRSLSSSPRAPKDPTLLSNTPLAIATPLPPSPESPLDPKFSESSNVYYQTTTTRSPRPTVLYPNHGSPTSFLSRYQAQSPSSGLGYNGQVPNDIFPPNLPPSLSSSLNSRLAAERSYSGPETPTPATYHNNNHNHAMHSIQSAPTGNTSRAESSSSPKVSVAQSSSRERSPLIPQDLYPAQSLDVNSLPKSTAAAASASHPNSPVIPKPLAPAMGAVVAMNGGVDDGITPPLPLSPSHLPSSRLPPMREDRSSSLSPRPCGGGDGAQVDSNSNGSSPTHSSTGYATSISRSPSPHSPSPPPTARLPPIESVGGKGGENGRGGRGGILETEMEALSIDNVNIVVDLDEGDHGKGR
ncbi:hypothetical protein M413DRAFT_27339 [Hebeloma cylindrosporum]|uniref:polynucleotide adenylyltransferase n=1 Tax=Hebeloma cylindrosporum TaxID=76867 RepID=A0A0C3CDT3_HEBCY|nr:hypothetical protein M413DRAFT_27339 [Hebeloma cylindrosporum h7]